MQYQLIIIGGGPGGVAAGVYCNAIRYAAARVLKPLGFNTCPPSLRSGASRRVSAKGNYRFPTPSLSINSRLNLDS